MKEEETSSCLRNWDIFKLIGMSTADVHNFIKNKNKTFR